MEGMYCLMNSGIRLSQSSRTLLFTLAQKMYQNRKQRINVTSSDCEGYIVTDWQTKGLGSFYGTAFVAKIATDEGDINVEYIVRMKKVDLEELEWGEMEIPSFAWPACLN